MPDDVNNSRMRQLIEQFNAEEAYAWELHSLMREWAGLIVSGADLTSVLAAFRRARPTAPKPPPVNAIGLWLE
jgi:hypothetical protein